MWGSFFSSLFFFSFFFYFIFCQRVTFAKGKSFAAMKEDGTFARYQAEQRQKATKGEGNLSVTTGKARPHAKSHAGGAMAVEAAAAAETSQEPEIPNVILFLENLPQETTQSMVAMLFQQLGGFKEVGRMYIYINFFKIPNHTHTHRCAW
jgi:muramoyltetrapeptide carboxypeptidase LdcA involved in peptidoglycan recycling